MYSVTQRISKIKQPRGGYINRKNFTIITLDDEIKLHEKENIHPSLVGLVVDYMTRFCMGTPNKKAFQISLQGATIAKDDYNAHKLLSKINGLDIESVTSASKLVGYDVCSRAGMTHFKPIEEINPDNNTIDNIIAMVKRSLSFWEQYGPIVKDGFTFEGGYTPIISIGDGDYLTKDTLWDFKVSKEELKPKYTLQLLIYYIIGKHSKYKEFDSIEKLGVYNPRLNKVYILNVFDISKNVIDTVSRDIIGYGISKEEFEKLQKTELEEIKQSLNKSHTQQESSKNFDYLDKKTYGYSSKREYISKAFPPKVQISNKSIYDRTPTFWSGNNIPCIITEKNLSYIIRFKACFKIKKGKKPFVMNKTSFLYPLRKPLTTSDFYDSETKKYYAKYIGRNGEIVESKPTLILTNDDFRLFNEIYNVKDLEILDGCYFL